MTEMTNGIATAAPTETQKPKPARKSKRKPTKRPAKRTSAASSKRGSGPKKKPGKRGAGAMVKQGRYVLVVHMTKETQSKLDRACKRTGDSRSSFVRAMLEKRLG